MVFIQQQHLNTTKNVMEIFFFYIAFCFHAFNMKYYLNKQQQNKQTNKFPDSMYPCKLLNFTSIKCNF